MGNSTYCDIVDLAHQKLDFSMLCQQAASSIYVMGGFIEDSQCFVERYDLQKEKWEIAGTFNNNRTKFSSLVLPNSKSILLLGGKQVFIFYIGIIIYFIKEGARTATCVEYCLADQVIKPSNIMLTSPKSGFGALVFKGF